MNMAAGRVVATPAPPECAVRAGVWALDFLGCAGSVGVAAAARSRPFLARRATAASVRAVIIVEKALYYGITVMGSAQRTSAEDAAWRMKDPAIPDSHGMRSYHTVI